MLCITNIRRNVHGYLPYLINFCQEQYRLKQRNKVTHVADSSKENVDRSVMFQFAGNRKLKLDGGKLPRNEGISMATHWVPILERISRSIKVS